MEPAPDLIPTAAVPDWEGTATVRRIVLLILVIIPTCFSAAVMHSLLPVKSGRFMNGLVTLLFAMLFAWVAVGFWSAMAGIIVALQRYDRFSIIGRRDRDYSLPAGLRTAILFPVYNEDTHKVAEGIRTVWQSIRKLGAEDNFDLFILSDSTNPDAWAREEEAWYRLSSKEKAEGRIFYRHRKINRKGKSGNVADFCRRWGASYPYMIVFDADSLMSGETLIRLVQAMERRPDVGIIQTAPKSINSRTPIARLQQFSNHLYGPVFAAGLNYWQLGDAQFWGHNAILRVQPFMQHCHLPMLPGRAPLGGHILSHDFVEAALMRRAGYGVWLAYDAEGSYEENPPSLIDELIRDRRWCQGNLQHSRLLFSKGFFPTHRALFVNGIMSYGSALLWFFFLLASSAQAVLELVMVPDYFPEGYSLFPDWPKFFSHRAVGLLGSTMLLLFLPKLFTLALVVLRRQTEWFGGLLGMCVSVAVEVIVSALLAPVRMIFHSFFVATTLLGFTVRWNVQNRDDSGTTWWQAIRFHWWGVAVGILWGWAMLMVNPGFFWWLSPIVAGLILSVPLSVITSNRKLGEAALRWGLFLTPADIHPPEVVDALAENLEKGLPATPFLIPPENGFTRTVVVPRLFSLHLTLLGVRGTESGRNAAEWAGLVEKAILSGPESLGREEKRRILSEPGCLSELHRRVWLLDSARAREWGIH